MKIKSFISIIIIGLVSSIVGSALTFNFMKSGYESNIPTKKEVQIINNGDTKQQNVYQAVAEKASPSVVGIISETVTTDNIFDLPEAVQDSGTGFVVDKKGYILTNAHVVNDGRAKKVKVIYDGGKTTVGSVVYADATMDLAIVKINAHGLVPAELGNSDNVRVGDIAIAIGNPLGTDLMTTVTQGIISGLNRNVSTKNSNISGLLQTDASINPGNSGGPLLNQDGQVIGINTVKAKADNLGFAIPINEAKVIVQKVIKNGSFKKPVLGITGIDVITFESYTGQDLGVDSGIIVRTVQPNSLASKLNLQPGDIIVNINNKDIRNLGDLSKILYSYTSGEKLNVRVIRNSKTITLHI